MAKRLKGDMSNLDDLMKEAGMISIDDLTDLNKQLPLDFFSAHVGVRDYDTFEQWFIMEYRSALKVKACYDLGEWEDDDNATEHAEGHCRAFGEIFSNWKMMKRRMQEAQEKENA